MELVQNHDTQFTAHEQPLRVIEVVGCGPTLQFVKLTIVPQGLVRPRRIAAARFVKLASRMRVASHLYNRRRARDGAGQIESVVAAEGVGMQVTVEAGQEVLRSITFAVEGEIENVVWMLAVAVVDPEARRRRGAGLGLQVLDRRVVGVQPA